MAANTVCLEMRRIGVEFDHCPVVRGIDLTIEEQEVVSIIGPNGAGKTTLLNLICGRIRPTSGSIRFRGREITGWAPHEICRLGIARTFQIARPFPEMSASENVQVALRFGKKSHVGFCRMRDKALELLDLVGLVGKADAPAKELTLSEQRRLEVARALGTQPRLLLLDEMAAGLSPHAINQAVELVKTLQRRGLTLLIIDHFLNLTAKVSNRLVAMDQGEKIAEGVPSEVLRHPEVISSYLGERQSGTTEEEHTP